VDQQLQERGLPQVLRAWDIDFGKGGRLDRDGAAADHRRRDQHAPVMMPFGPIQRDEHSLPAPEELQHLGRELLILDVGVAQQSVEAGQSTAELRPQLDGEMPGHGHGVGLGPLSHRGDHEGEGLLLRTPKGASQGLQDRVS
jgi:hypothetical protein